MTSPVAQSPVDTEERLPTESIGDYTNRMARLGGQLGIRRQCSIGWHYECSDPCGHECRCACHPERERNRALPLPKDAGYYVDRDGDPWQRDEAGRWLFGADDAQDPHDSAPFIRMRPISDKDLLLAIDALHFAAENTEAIAGTAMATLAARLDKDLRA